jgi:uncharacterized protein YbjT (DUF2867 family)
MIKNAGIEGSNYSALTTMPLVHPSDIAVAVAEELVKKQSGNNVRYVVGDIRTGAGIAQALGTAIGKPELPWVEFTDAQAIQGMTQAGLSEELANLYAEMGAGFRNGSITEHFVEVGSPVSGKVKLENFATHFASVFS